MTRIIFMGTPEFAVPSLDALVDSGFKPIAVVTAPDRPKGRGLKVLTTPVKEAARRLDIDLILQPDSVKDAAFVASIQQLNADIIVVVAFRILPPSVFKATRLGSFNLHGSLLPKYRGAAPIHRAIMAGERETGVTTFFLKEKVDTGNVIMKRSMPIGPDETTGEVHDRMMILGADVVLETVRQIVAGTVVVTEQNEEEASAAPKIFREDCKIAWDRDVNSVHDFVRGLSPFPGAWTMHEGTVLKFFRTRMVAGDEPAWSGSTPGVVVDTDGRFLIACGEGCLDVLEIQQEGKRRLQASDFLRGYPVDCGDQLE